MEDQQFRTIKKLLEEILSALRDIDANTNQ